MMRRAQPRLGTLVEITIADDMSDADSAACFSAAFAEIAKVHRLMSFHDPDSDVSRINRAVVEEEVEVHALTCEVIRAALEMSVASEGVFDMTCAPILAEWGFLPQPDGVCPPGRTGTSADVILEGSKVIKRTPLWIDLGGIAKGHAVDIAISALRQRGVRSACVNAGGDLRVLGETPYRIAVRNPARPSEVVREIELSDCALATSGTYFSRKQVGSVECTPLINGKTGQAVCKNFSASVLARDCMTADALTKIVMSTEDENHVLLSRFDATALII